MTYLIWKCENCNRKHYSINKRHHEMNVCECDQSGVDFETYCCRMMGDVTILEELDWNFFDEIILCYTEQGYKITGWMDYSLGYPVQRLDLVELKDLEDEILEGYIHEE